MSEPCLRIDPLGQGFGAIVSASSSHIRSLDTNHVASLFKEHGAIQLRGLAAKVEDFMWLSAALSDGFSTYLGGGLRWGPLDRESIGGNDTLMTVSGGSQGFPILLHGEMYYLKKHPPILWFFCERAAEKGGETILCDGEILFQHIKPATRDLLKRKPIKYVRNLTREEWMVAFKTEDINELRRICEENDSSLEIYSDATIKTEYVCSSITKSRGRGKEAFVNNLVQMYAIEWAFKSGWILENLPDLPRRTSPMVVRFADGSRLPSNLFDELNDLSTQLSASVSWQDGDILMVDNTRLLHGRNQTFGSRRKILVRMSEPGFDW